MGARNFNFNNLKSGCRVQDFLKKSFEVLCITLSASCMGLHKIRWVDWPVWLVPLSQEVREPNTLTYRKGYGDKSRGLDTMI